VEPADGLNQAGRKQRGLQEGFETTEEIVTANNGPAGRLIDDECSGKNVNKCKEYAQSGKHDDSRRDTC
jgi:hypothetical protein